jgi:hypothetical protein
VANAYEVTSLELKQLAETNELEYSLASNTVTNNLTIARQREQALFGPDGLLTMALGLAGVGGLGTVIGKFAMRKPGEWSPEEVESELGNLNVEVSNKERQLIELVHGIQSFINLEDGESQKTLKNMLAQAQSSDTREDVAKIKANI